MTDLPTTPADALRWAADRLGRHGDLPGWPALADSCGVVLHGWADDLADAPAVFALPAEPPPEVTELWDRDGHRWEWSDGEDGTDSGWQPETSDGTWEWPELLVDHGPLSTVPPEGGEVSDAG